MNNAIRNGIEIVEEFANLFAAFRQDRSEESLKEIRRESLALFYRFLFQSLKACAFKTDPELCKGSVFDPDRHPFLEQFIKAGDLVNRAVEIFSNRSSNVIGPKFDISYIGALYEKILELEPQIDGAGCYRFEYGSQERRRSGSYYTPAFIVDYIVESTLGPLVRKERRNSVPLGSDELLKLKVVDPAMGSGNFLVAAVDYLARAYADALAREDANDLSSDEMMNCCKRKIASQCIYGVDIDPMAVESAILSIWLSITDGEPPPLLNHRLKCGNALLGFDWKLEFPEVFLNSDGRGNAGFSALVGNPPYIGQKDNKAIFDPLINSPTVGRYYESKMDLWHFFAEIALDLTERNGFIGLLATDYWMSAEGASILRETLCTRASFKKSAFFNGSVFPQAVGIHSNILIFENDDSADAPPAEILVLKPEYNPPACFNGVLKLPLEWFSRRLSPPKSSFPKDGNCVNLKFARSRRNETSESECRRLGSLCEIHQGIVPGPDSVGTRAWRRLCADERKRIRPGDSVFVLSLAEIDQLNLSETEKRLLRPFFPARQITPVIFNQEPERFIIYSSQETAESISEFPKIRAHLERCRPLMEKRRETLKGKKPWHHLHWPRREKLFLEPKIASVRQTLQPVFSYSESPAFFDLSVNIISHSDKDLLKALALYLSTDRIREWLLEKGKTKGKIFQIDRGPLEKIPIPLDLSEKGSLYEKLLEIFRELENGSLSAQEAIAKIL